MKTVFSGLCLLWAICLSGQSIPDDWDTYVIMMKEHPVSIVVNLGLKEKAPIKERPYAIIMRTQYKADGDGQPDQDVLQRMDSMENELVAALQRGLGAVYTGRFSQRGLREFYFYALDSVGYLPLCNDVMRRYPDYPWLAKSVYDKNWTNYFEVLYPSDKELEKIENRKMIETLKVKGDGGASRKIDHLVLFRNAGSRETFLKEFKLPGFQILQMPTEKTESGDYPFKLVMSREDKPEYEMMNQITIYFRQLSAKNNGRYEGWDTFVVPKSGK